MAALAAAPPPPDGSQQLVEDALGRALDAGKTGPELLSALHAAAPHLEMAAMHSLLEDYKAKEDAKLFDLVAENYRDFFRIATSVEGSAEDAAATQAALLALEGEASKAAATAGVEQARLLKALARAGELALKKDDGAQDSRRPVWSSPEAMRTSPSEEGPRRDPLAAPLGERLRSRARTPQPPGAHLRPRASPRSLSPPPSEPPRRSVTSDE